MHILASHSDLSGRLLWLPDLGDHSVHITLMFNSELIVFAPKLMKSSSLARLPQQLSLHCLSLANFYFSQQDPFFLNQYSPLREQLNLSLSCCMKAAISSQQSRYCRLHYVRHGN